ncbi:MAG: hypothetical protein QM726_23665 [Chitinophagaceae bacterium]
MKTSNKIILGIFTLPLLILTLLQLALYAKYKSGNYISMKVEQENRFIKKSFTNISHIAVYGINNCSIMPSDSLRLEIEKSENGHLHFAVVGDSLIIHGDTIVSRGDGRTEAERSYQDVNLYLPLATVGILANNSDVSLKGSKDSTKSASYFFSVVNDGSLKVEDGGDDNTHVYFKGLTINASHSSGIELTSHTRVNDLQLTMVESAFTDNGAMIDKLMIDADKLSNISLKGDNLRKLNMVH